MTRVGWKTSKGTGCLPSERFTLSVRFDEDDDDDDVDEDDDDDMTMITMIAMMMKMRTEMFSISVRFVQ